MTSFARYLAHTYAPNPEFQLSDLKFTAASFWKTVQSSSYDALRKTMGTKTADRFAKLYLFPAWPTAAAADRTPSTSSPR